MADARPIVRNGGLLARETWYDMRGRLETIPGLAVAFSTTYGFGGSVEIAPPDSGFSRFLALPQLFNDRLNLRLLGTASFVRHEVAHLVLDHVNYPGFYGRFHTFSVEYFNHPCEIEAYTHQALARTAMTAHGKQRSWSLGPLAPAAILGADSGRFASRVLSNYPRRAFLALTPANRLAVREDVTRFFHEALSLAEA